MNIATLISAERLSKIAELLETDISELFDSSKVTIQNQNSECTYGNGYVENLHIENREMHEKIIEQYEQRLKEKDEQIALLKSLMGK